MKRALFLFCALASLVSAMDEVQIRSFISGSVTAENVSRLGFVSVDQADRIVFGPAVELFEVSGDSLKTYPSTGFAESSNCFYLPIIADGSVRCFAVIDSLGQAVSLGYVKLAQELSRAAVQNGIALEDIRLYRSTQINSYLISIHSKSRGSDNLIILQPNWNSNSRAAYPSEAETIDRIRRAGGSK